MHLLEDHLVPFLKSNGAGLGLLGEQGAESIHARFNSIQKTVHMPSSSKRLESIMTEHYRQICPQNISKIPEKKVYKKKMSNQQYFYIRYCTHALHT